MIYSDAAHLGAILYQDLGLKNVTHCVQGVISDGNILHNDLTLDRSKLFKGRKPLIILTSGLTQYPKYSSIKALEVLNPTL